MYIETAYEVHKILLLTDILSTSLGNFEFQSFMPIKYINVLINQNKQRLPDKISEF